MFFPPFVIRRFHCSLPSLYACFTVPFPRYTQVSLIPSFVIGRFHSSLPSLYASFTVPFLRYTQVSLFPSFVIRRFHCSLPSLYAGFTVPFLRYTQVSLSSAARYEMLYIRLLLSPSTFEWYWGSFQCGVVLHYVAYIGDRRGANRLPGGRPWGLGRPSRSWEDNFKMDLQEVGWDMDWTDLAEDRDRWRAVANAVMNPRGFIKCGEFLD